MPDIQISGSMIDAALEAFNAADSVPFAIPFDCMRAAFTAAIAGNVVVPKATQTEIVRICNSAEHDARYTARKLDDNPMRHGVEVLAGTFKLIRAMIDAGDAA